MGSTRKLSLDRVAELRTLTQPLAKGEEKTARRSDTAKPRLMCGRPLAFRQDGFLDFGDAQFVGGGEAPNFIAARPEAQSASAHQAAEPLA
jgi:hypothetical protein